MAERVYDLAEAAAISQAQAFYYSEGTYQTLFSVPSDTDEMLAWLARLRLLQGVPFAYLVNDAELLPPESIRFFYLDRNWTDTLTEGALSVGTITSRDRAQLQSAYPELKADIDSTERQLFQSKTGADVTAGNAEVATGFLLRSRAVSGWPGLHVHAFRGEDSDQELGIMRIERLAPAVLLALFDGLPKFVTITEPRQGIQFGVNPDPANAAFRLFRVRDDNGEEQTDIPQSERRVPFRTDSPGVIHWKEFAQRLAGHLGGSDVSSATVGLHMLRFPYQQDFGDPPLDPDRPSTFVTNVSNDVLVASNNAEWLFS